MRFSKAYERVRRFFPADDGSIAIISAILVFVLAGLAFGVTDITRASVAKSRLQQATDAATLAAARSGAKDAPTLQSVGETYLLSMAKSGDVRDIKGNFVLVGENVVGTATGYVDPILLGLFLDGPMKIASETEVTREATLTTEVALVLDTTASMSGAKLTTLKAAAKDLALKLMKGGGSQVRMAVVPFANYVNVGVSRKNEPWVKMSPAEWTEVIPASCTKVKKTVCTVPSKSYKCTTYNDGVPNPNGTCWTTASGCTTTETGAETCKPASTKPHVFKGCVGSPVYPGNVRDTDPSRKYPGFLDITCAQEFTPLTSVQAQVVAATQSLTANENTYIPAGLAWGWNVLSSPVPITDGAAYDSTGENKRPRKVLVLMTDGANSMSMAASTGRHNSVGGAVPTQANQYTKELCDNIKAAKIELFAVAFEITDPTAKALIKNCATDGSHYYDATNAAALSAAFAAIGDSLQEIRIAR